MTDTAQLLTRRERLFGPDMPTFYRDPVHLVRGAGVWLWDADGRPYLDAYNNVAHVGHAHPKVVEAIARQAATLNTHSRYLHAGVLDYGERLIGTFGAGLDTFLMVCTGSEANDVALRMAQAATGKCGFIGTDSTYHGNTALVSQLNARKPPIGGHERNFRQVPAPDAVRDGREFARHVARAIDDLEEAGHGFAALVLDPFFANEGFPAVAPDFLRPAKRLVERARGMIIADEVQPGFGRLGSHFWGHQRAGIAPDIVTLGKPMGNGHPVAGVVARRPVMEAFRKAFGYFNTFGANPVSAAAAMAVLEVIAEEGLQENARRIGDRLLDGLSALRHARIVQMRGAGLFVGVEFGGDAAGEFTAGVVNAMRDAGVLVGRTGRHGNVLKIRPPMCIDCTQADIVVERLSAVLARAGA